MEPRTLKLAVLPDGTRREWLLSTRHVNVGTACYGDWRDVYEVFAKDTKGSVTVCYHPTLTTGTEEAALAAWLSLPADPEPGRARVVLESQERRARRT